MLLSGQSLSLSLSLYASAARVVPQLIWLMSVTSISTVMQPIYRVGRQPGGGGTLFYLGFVTTAPELCVTNCRALCNIFWVAHKASDDVIVDEAHSIPNGMAFVCMGVCGQQFWTSLVFKSTVLYTLLWLAG